MVSGMKRKGHGAPCRLVSRGRRCGAMRGDAGAMARRKAFIHSPGARPGPAKVSALAKPGVRGAASSPGVTTMAPKPRPAASDSSYTCSEEEDEDLMPQPPPAKKPPTPAPAHGSHGDVGDRTRQPAPPPPPKRKAAAAAAAAAGASSRAKKSKTGASSRKGKAAASAGEKDRGLGDKSKAAAYRFLWEEVVAVDADAQKKPRTGGMFKDLFSKLPDGEASALNAKLKKQRKDEVQVHQRWIDVANDIVTTLVHNLE
ncbi:hypothetical protein ACP4OV_016687 [Aristida adscensionis]